MYYTKFGQLYRSLSAKEIRLLKQWVQSPMHNKHKDVERLYEFLFTRRTVSELVYKKERIFNYLYPQQPYNDLRMRHVLSLALNILNDFVRYNVLVLENGISDFLWIKDLRERNLPKLAEQALNKAQDKLHGQPYRSGAYYLHQFHLDVEKMAQRGTQHRIGTNNLEEISGSLSLFFIINTLRYACVHFSHQSLRQAECNIILLDAVIAEVESRDYEAHPVVMAYYYIYKALTHPKEEAYFKLLKRCLLDHAALFPSEEYKNCFLQALNYCIKRLNVGGETYIREAFELYLYGLEHKVLFNGKQLSPFTYKNVVALGLRLEKFDWVATFIPTYAAYLPDENRTSYVHYNTARLYCAQGNYKASLSLLAQTDYDDVFMNMDAKVMQLKMYYEEEEYDVLEALLQSFSVFLQRKNIMGYHREHYKNVILFIKKFLSTPHFDKETKALLRQQIEETEPLPERPWLLKQLE